MLEFFTDPILRAPTLGSMLMCFASGLIGCLAFLQKRTLVGEALSHATYPGIMIAAAIAATFSPFPLRSASIAIFFGAFAFGLLGLLAISWLEKKLRIASDAALCLVLSLFFGVGVLLASSLQQSHPLWLQQVQIFLFGQAATLLDAHIWGYGLLALFSIGVIVTFYRTIEILHFDVDFARSLGVRTQFVQSCIDCLLVLAIVVGMRSVGVILMSSMLIAPAAGARQWTKSLSGFFFLSSIFGAVSGFLGSASSLWIPRWVGIPNLSLPTGPMIVLCVSTLCVFSLLFAPKRGYVTKLIRIWHFRQRSSQENILKALYKNRVHPANRWLLWRMYMKGWIKEGRLTEEGRIRAEKLIRLHRLWEVYLVHMGQDSQRVHQSAEEMEHILTPEIEEELMALLDDPEQDPHKQPIPRGLF